jgi:hypothetical protein
VVSATTRVFYVISGIALFERCTVSSGQYTKFRKFLNMFEDLLCNGRQHMIRARWCHLLRVALRSSGSNLPLIEGKQAIKNSRSMKSVASFFQTYHPEIVVATSDRKAAMRDH